MVPEKREERVCEVCGVLGDDLHFVHNSALVETNDLILDNYIGRIWKNPDVFTLIRRRKSIDLL